ncbi:MAG: FGGY-family carbohydrate kinase [Spirochaetota bacterium]
MRKCFLGIDSGGTVTKAVISDAEGRVVASAARRVPLIVPRPGFTERDMGALWQATVEVIKESLSLSGLKAGQIGGIACTGHGKGLYLWGSDGNPAYNGIVSTDSRAWSYPERWERDGTAAKVFAKTCQRILACQPVSLLCWLRDNDPEVLDRVRWIFEVKDYLRFMLTGEAFAEMTDYSGSNLMNLHEGRYDRELLGYFGLERIMEMLPPLRLSTDRCGEVTSLVAAATGLPAGTPVAGGMFDIDACAVAMDVTDEEKLCVIAGTWSINEYVSKKPVLDGSVMMNSLFCIPGYFLVEESSPTSAGNYEWFCTLFLEAERREAEKGGISLYEFAGEMAATVGPDDQHIVFLPYIFGSNYDPRARASFVGLTSAHSRAQVIRAVMEGIVFCHLVHIEKLLANRERTTVVRLAGGAANSRAWVKIFADVLGLPVEIVDVAELGALGCAMAAAVASGLYPDLKDAAGHMMKIKYRQEPEAANAAVYGRKYALYKRVSAALEETWREFPEGR